MREGELLFTGLFGAAAVAFGLWLRPRWRRVRDERLRRRDTVFFARGRELWLWLNAFGSLVIGAALVAIVLGELGLQLRERARRAELERFALRCDRQSLTVENRGDARRRLRLSELEVLVASGRLLEAPERWKARFGDPIDRALDPGERLVVPWIATPGLCERPRGLILLPLDEPAGFCQLSFLLRSDAVEGRVVCPVE
jgi:hypothetical protein